jgi:peroxiredoxin
MERLLRQIFCLKVDELTTNVKKAGFKPSMDAIKVQAIADMKHEFSKVMETIVQENNLAEYIITF